MMECNKEEAIKARDVAEKNMENKEFIGARKMALKAQKLYPDLDNISHMLTVCEVHCSAAVKVNGEMDWYGILQVEPTADDSSIKKQYRKFALLLHPDKNQFTGAEAAFKLVGEAHMTLSDTVKRHNYDMRRNSNNRSVPTRQQPQHLRKTSYASNNFTKVNFNAQNQRQPSSSEVSQTFWTMCPNCGMRFQYWLTILKKLLRCQNCQTAFIAEELNQNAKPSGVSSSHSQNTSGMPQNNPFQPKFSSAGVPGKMSAKAGTNSGNAGEPENLASDVRVHNRSGIAPNDVKVESAKVTEVDQGKKASKPLTANVGQKRSRRMIVDTSDSDSTDSEDDAIDNFGIPASNFAFPSGPRRSTRVKQKVTYVEPRGEEDYEEVANPRTHEEQWEPSTPDERGESLSNGDVDANCIRSGANRTNVFDDIGLTNGTADRTRSVIKEETVGSGAEPSHCSSSKSSLEAHTLSYPDPEFYDFENFRSVDQFAVDQIWAVYDDVDGMPRFYAHIKKICSPDFRVKFSWLEHHPRNEFEVEWSEEKLPVACGSFIKDNKLDTGDRMMFSHIISWEKGRVRNSYYIYPKKGDVWALFKNWSITWCSDSKRDRNYEYDVVEVLSDFSAVTGISVIPLVKVEGFVSLFMRAKDKEVDPPAIPTNEIFRFSHNIPAYRLTGKERECVPEGSFELDPASLPESFMDKFPSVNVASSTTGVGRLDECSDPFPKGIKTSRVREMKNEHEDLPHEGITDYNVSKNNQAQNSCHSESWKHVPTDPKMHNLADKDDIVILDSDDDGFENGSVSLKPSAGNQTYNYPNSQFHVFDEGRTIRKLHCGQVWSFYSDIDKYPKYYGVVKKVEAKELRVHVTWLEACPILKVERRWVEEGMPISSGIFKVIPEIVVFEGIESFSHLMHAKPQGMNQFVILPNRGEIWALYKNWKAGWRRSNLEQCEYDVVEIYQTTGSGIKIRLLTKVDGYTAVFRFKKDANVANAIEIPVAEYTRFSHQIPAFVLTDQDGGKLRGCWELDTASLPDCLLTSNS